MYGNAGRAFVYSAEDSEFENTMRHNYTLCDVAKLREISWTCLLVQRNTEYMNT